MDKSKLEESTDKAFNNTHTILQLIYDELNKGQRKKLLNNSDIRSWFEHFNVHIEDDN